MQSKKRSLSYFTKIRSTVSNSSKSEPSPVSTGRLYRSIQTLPLDRFITAVCDEDLSSLIIEGVPTEEELNAAWTDIFLEYLDANNDNGARYKITLRRDIAVLEAKLTQVESSLYVLQIYHVQELVDVLRGLGYEDLQLDPANIDQYFADLNDVRNRSRELKIDKELKEIELSELEASDSKKERKRADRQSFLNILSRIATFKHVAIIRTSEITVAEFCAMFSEYLDNIKAIQAANKKRA
jgi:hypothetical protein